MTSTTINLPVLTNVRVASPCPMKWENMQGNEQVRHCEHCNLNVYNLSNMTTAQAESLILKSEGRICAGFVRRLDGTILTRDCPVGLAAARAAITRIACRISAVAAAVTTAVVFGFTRQPSGDRLALSSQEPFSTLATLLGRPAPAPVMMLGKISVTSSLPPSQPPVPAQTPSPSSAGRSQ